MSAIKFGTDGWRAIIARDFTFANCRVVAQAIASYINGQNLGKKGLVIGYDNRFLSEEFAADCARVIAGNGIKVYLFKKASPTPQTAFAIRARETAGAIMITASHNPPQYQGIKFIPWYAGPALPEVTDVIEEELERVAASGKVYELDLIEASRLHLYEEIDLEKEYSAALLALVNSDHIKKNPPKVVIDPMFGAGIGFLERILGDMGCEIRSINNYRDPLFGGSLPEPVESVLQDLKRTVITYNADIGLAMDGDADRFGLIDHDGTFISANRFMSLLLHHLLTVHKFRGPVCRSLATTHMLDRIARKNGIETIETPVGFKYIGSALRDNSCIMGGEESGGLSVIGHVPEKDGILACLLAVEMVAYSDKTLGELEEDLVALYGPVNSQRLDIRVKPEDWPDIIERMREYSPIQLGGIRVEALDRREGLKILLEDESWALIRVSGTEPLFRVYVEACSEKQMAEIQKEVIEALGLE